MVDSFPVVSGRSQLTNSMYITSRICLGSVFAALLALGLAEPSPFRGPQNPTVVIIPGAWHIPRHYFLLQDLLQRSGYPVQSHRNPSCDSSNPNATSVIKDASYLRDKVILPLLDAGKDVVLAMHSYGGLPGPVAAKGLSRKERTAAGKRGGVLGLVMISAILGFEGKTLIASAEGHFPPWVALKVNHRFHSQIHSYVGIWTDIPYHQDNGQLQYLDPRHVFYTQVNDSLAAEAISWLEPQSIASFTTPSGAPAWADPAFEGRLAYWSSTSDQCLPPPVQKLSIQATGVNWTVEDFPSDHSAFLSFPSQLSQWMIGIMRSWQSLS